MKVLAIGSAMIDTIAIIGSARIERMTMLNADSSFLFLEEGRGMDVAVLAKLGSDERADTILRHLKQEGVSTAWMRRDPHLGRLCSHFLT